MAGPVLQADIRPCFVLLGVHSTGRRDRKCLRNDRHGTLERGHQFTEERIRHQSVYRETNDGRQKKGGENAHRFSRCFCNLLATVLYC